MVERGRRNVGERVTGSGTVDAVRAKKRDGKQARYMDGGNREIETKRRSGRQGGGIGRKQRHQQLPLSGRLAVIMRNKLPL